MELNTGLKLKLINIFCQFISFSWLGVYIAKGSKINVQTSIGTNTRINGPCIVKGAGTLVIGKYCAIGDNLRVITSNHNYHSMCLQFGLQQKLFNHSSVAVKKNIEIKNDVWVGDSVLLLPGISIGNGAVIAAGSVVTKDVGAYTVVAGNPAKKISNRASQEVAQLFEKIEWWNWSDDVILKNKDFFRIDLQSVSEEVIKKSIKYE